MIVAVPHAQPIVGIGVAVIEAVAVLIHAIAPHFDRAGSSKRIAIVAVEELDASVAIAIAMATLIRCARERQTATIERSGSRHRRWNDCGFHWIIERHIIERAPSDAHGGVVSGCAADAGECK